MLSYIVGQVDGNAAVVLVALFASVAVVIVTVFVNWTSPRQFELTKMRQEDAQRLALFQSETQRAYQFKQLEQNLITSHRETTQHHSG
jgi:Tfp pilus assembly protein PilO